MSYTYHIMHTYEIIINYQNKKTICEVFDSHGLCVLCIGIYMDLFTFFYVLLSSYASTIH